MTIEIFDNLSFYDRLELLHLANDIVAYYISTNLVNKSEDHPFSVYFENNDQLKLYTYHKKNYIVSKIVYRNVIYEKKSVNISSLVKWLLKKANS